MLLRFMIKRRSFREDIYNKFVLCGKDNDQIHMLNECKELEKKI